MPCFKAVILKLRGASPLGSSEPFTGVTNDHQNTDTYIMIRNGSKITVMNSNENDFMIGSHHNMGTVVKSVALGRVRTINVC